MTDQIPLNNTSLQKSKARLEGIDAFVLQEMETWKVPGLALTVVQGDTVLYVAGYGYRDRNRQLPVTTSTLFPIASVTKSFTATMLSVLVNQGKLEWDKPIREYIPAFRLWDTNATEHVTMRDLITHRTGLPRHDWVWQDESLSRAELFHRLRYLEPTHDLRQTFLYNNLMYIAAGYIAEHITDSTWEELVHELLFAPLGMERVTLTLAELEQADDHSLPYELDDAGVVHQGQFRKLDALAPAGGIGASIEAMTHYLRMHVNFGRYADQGILPDRATREMQTPQIYVPGPQRYSEFGHTQYALGFYTSPYRGQPQVRHNGNIRGGFATQLTLMPEQQIGVMVMANLNNSNVPRIITLQVIDRLLGLPPAPWNERARQTAAVESNKKPTPPKPDTCPSHPLAEYAGVYTHPAYGTIKIRQNAQTALYMEYQGSAAPVRHFHYDVFETPADKLSRLESIKIRFETDWEGNIARLCIAFEAGISDIVFGRTKD